MEEIYKKLQTSADTAGVEKEGNADDKFNYWKTEGRYIYVIMFTVSLAMGYIQSMIILFS